ncbi:MAG: hypothetical protein K9L24_05300, partial [Spirochaetia bacterium]|nr:hypothetical protein [Spirochaetia bacterium]
MYFNKISEKSKDNKHAGKVSGSKFRKRFVVLLLILCMLLSMGSAFAKVRSVRSRAISTKDDIVFTTKKYARMDSSIFLNKPFISVSIQNGPGNTKVEIALNIIIESDDTAWDSETSVTVYREIDSNEKVVFKNDDITTNLDSYLNSFEIGEFDSDFSSDSFDYNDLLLPGAELPEGKYTIYFTVNEINPETGENLEGGIEGWKSVEENFLVVSLNNLIITETPNKDTLDSPELVWELPEIPKYDDDSSDYITTSLATITGDNVDFTKRIQHEEVKREGSSELKGYPDDTYFSDGEVALDLSSENLSFRMGEEYEFIVSFLDWNDELIKYAESTYTFPAYYPKYYAPDGEEVETLTPTFEWSFDEYQEWVESYDLYLNGRLFEENISGTTFTPDEALNFGDEFTWYVIPSYSSDGSPFFTTPPETAAFSTFDHAPPELVISVPGSGDEIFNGESYTFTADIETFDDTDIESVEWTVNGESYSGDSIDFEPSGLPTGTLQVSCTVTDSLGSTDTEAAEVVILNPRVAIDDVADRTVFAHEEVNFTIDPGNSGDVDEYIWSVISPDGSEESFSGDTLAFEFTQLGEYEITAAGLKEDSFGNEKEVSSGKSLITVESSGPPQLVFLKPAAMGLLAAGQEVGFTADISSTSEDIQNEITETIWEVNGEEFTFDGIQESF